jgi:hypothetical protein
MCPDRKFVSLYFDGELPSPWREKMEAHLESCGECRAVLAGYKNLGEQLREVSPAPQPSSAPQPSPTALASPTTLEAAQERVWEKLSGRQARARTRIWNRCVTLPLPAAAAVLVVIIFFALIGIRGLTRPSPQNPMVTVGIGLDDYGMVPIQDMTGVLQYLSSQDNGDFMVILLPESRKFSRIGEPAWINAADYSRSNTSR